MSNKKRRVDIERTSALMQKVKNSNFPKPKENIMASESTGIVPLDLRPQLKTDASTDHVLGMRDMGFYSDKYAMDRIEGKMGYPASTYGMVRHPGADSTELEKKIAKGPEKPDNTGQGEGSLTRLPTHKKGYKQTGRSISKTTTKPSTTKPNPKEGYKQSYGLKAEKKQRQQGTPLKQYTYTTSEADSYKAPKVDVQKDKKKATRKSKKAIKKGDWMGAFVAGEDVKTKTVNKKRAERMKKRGWTESMKY